MKKVGARSPGVPFEGVDCQELPLVAVILLSISTLPGICIPTSCISHVVLTAQLEGSTCPC